MMFVKFFSLIGLLVILLLFSPVRLWIGAFRESAPVEVAEKQELIDDFFKKTQVEKELPVALLDAAVQAAKSLDEKHKEMEMHKIAAEWFLTKKVYEQAKIHGEHFLHCAEAFSFADDKQKALLLLSQLYFQKGKESDDFSCFAEARNLCLKGLAREKEAGYMDPKDEGYFCLILGEIALKDQEADLKKGLAYLETAERHLGKDPSYPSCICSLAKLYLLTGEIAKASKTLMQVKETDIAQDQKLFAEFLYLQAEILALEGDLAKAFEILKKAYPLKKNVSQNEEKKMTALYLELQKNLSQGGEIF